MSLSAVLTALAEFVGTEWAAATGAPADRSLRYIGTDGMPQDCCTENGVLSVTFDRGYPSDTFPSEAASSKHPCPGLPVYVLVARMDVCWPKPGVGPQGVEVNDVNDTAYDTKAAALSDAADQVFRALLTVNCGATPSEAGAALLATVRNNAFSAREVSAKITGDCVRITWRVYAGPRTGSS